MLLLLSSAGTFPLSQTRRVEICYQKCMPVRVIFQAVTVSVQSLSIPVCPQAGDEGKACTRVLTGDPCWKRQGGGEGAVSWLRFCHHCREDKATRADQAAQLITPGPREIRGGCTLLPCRQVTAAALGVFCCSASVPGPASKIQVCADFPGSEFVIFVIIFFSLGLA